MMATNEIWALMPQLINITEGQLTAFLGEEGKKLSCAVGAVKRILGRYAIRQIRLG